MNILPELRKFSNIKNPLFQFFLFLSFFGCVASYDYLHGALMHEQIAFLVSVLLGLAVAMLLSSLTLQKTSLNPYNFLISTIIVILLVHPRQVLWHIPLGVFSVWFGKKLFRLDNVHIFNPAALGLALLTILSMIAEDRSGSPGVIISWWGADLGQQFLADQLYLYFALALFFLCGFIYFARAFKKLWYVISFTLSYLAVGVIVISLIDGGSVAELLGVTVRSLILSAISFMVLVMFVEPKTSPAIPKQQIAVGLLGAMLLHLLNSYGYAVPIDPLVLTVLGVNIATYILKTRRLLQ